MRVLPARRCSSPGSMKLGSEPGRYPPSFEATSPILHRSQLVPAVPHNEFSKKNALGHHRIAPLSVVLAEREVDRRLRHPGRITRSTGKGDAVLRARLGVPEEADVDDEPRVNCPHDGPVRECVAVDQRVPRMLGGDARGDLGLGIPERGSEGRRLVYWCDAYPDGTGMGSFGCSFWWRWTFASHHGRLNGFEGTLLTSLVLRMIWQNVILSTDQHHNVTKQPLRTYGCSVMYRALGLKVSAQREELGSGESY